MGLCNSNIYNQDELIRDITCNAYIDRHAFDVIVMGYIRQLIEEQHENKNPIKTKLNLTNIPQDIQRLIVIYYGGVHGTLTIEEDEYKELKCTKTNDRYLFDSILINENGTLSVNSWLNKQSGGGSLHIVCYGDIILNKGSKIDLNGKGYKGGKGNKSGQSYLGRSKDTDQSNYGGGGGGQISQHGYGTGGGAGYGTLGQYGMCWLHCNKHQDIDDSGVGGGIYGDNLLTKLYLGSGGGGGTTEQRFGGDGGGALKIECFGCIILKEFAKITCNGSKGESSSGSGSGGSVHIIIKDIDHLIMDKDSYIEAIGGPPQTQKFFAMSSGYKCTKYNGNAGCIGQGGSGRIRIQFLKDGDDEYRNSISWTSQSYGSNEKTQSVDILRGYNIRPQPYIG